MYAESRGVPQNHAEAARRLSFAAEQGIDDAAVKLSGMYATAHLMCSVVDAEFTAGAKEMRDALAAKMTPEQINIAKRLADETRRKGKR